MRGYDRGVPSFDAGAEVLYGLCEAASVGFVRLAGNSKSAISVMPSTLSNKLHELEIRVAYQETDGQRRVHHGNYLNYFERGRVEMLRSAGVSYKHLEDSGLMLVVAEMSIKYHAAAEFDDLLQLQTRVVEIRKVRMRHQYIIRRDGDLIVEAESVIACIDREGRPSRIPADLLTTFE
tara:strand:- start:463899 stop:464432 length:534 start_codon:yes stop_codon:yes gene_type:complete